MSLVRILLIPRDSKTTLRQTPVKQKFMLLSRYLFLSVLNKFFCPPAGKRQLPGRCAKRSCRFPAPSSRKIVYWPWPVKQKASDHMFVNLGFASADNYMWSETFLILLAMGRNILFCERATYILLFTAIIINKIAFEKQQFIFSLRRIVGITGLFTKCMTI